jgi:hypothetical protein
MARSKTLRRSIGISGIFAGVACMTNLIQGNGALTQQNTVLLGVFGVVFFFGAAIIFGWHKAPVPIGTPVRTLLILLVCLGLMGAVCWHVWPQSPQAIGSAITQKIGEQDAVIGKNDIHQINVAPCHSDKLSDCSDEQLYQWGTSLYTKIDDIEKKFAQTAEIARTTADIQEQLRLYKTSEAQLASDFWECCAVDTMRYLRELQSRIGGGSGHEYDKTNEWLASFSKPPLFGGGKNVTYQDGMMTVLASLQLTVLHARLGQRIGVSPLNGKN